MPVQQLSLDIWLRIVLLIEVGDVLALAATCTELRQDLLSNQIWHQIRATHWGQTVTSYGSAYKKLIDSREREALLDNDNNNNNNSRSIDRNNNTIAADADVGEDGANYRMCLSYIQKQRRIEMLLPTYEPRGSRNVAYFLDTFSADPNYIPILVEYLLQWRSSLSVSHYSLVLNLLIAQNYRQGFVCLLELLDEDREKTIGLTHPVQSGIALDCSINNHLYRNINCNSSSLTSLSQYEEFYFRLSYFDKAFHRLAPFREKFYGRLNKVVRFHVNAWLGDSVEQSKFLWFESEDNFIDFVVWIMNKALEKFGNYKWLTNSPIGLQYLQSYYLEDFSILRLYAGEVMAHPYLVFSVLLRLLDEVMAGLQLVIGKEYIKLDSVISISQQAIKIHDSYLFLHAKLPMKNEILKLKHDDIPTVLFANNRNRAAASQLFESFTRPLHVIDLCRHYFLLQSRGYTHSVSELLEVRLNTATSTNIDTTQETALDRIAKWFPHLQQGIMADNFRFLEKSYQYLMLLSRNLIGSARFFVLSEMEKQFNHSTYFIHFNALWLISVKLNTKSSLAVSKINPFSEYFKVGDIQNTDSPFGRFFNLNDPKLSRILWARIRGQSKIDNDRMVKEGSYANGSFVYIPKWDSYGVVVGHVLNSSNDTTYLRIYTVMGELEVYSEDNIEHLQPNIELTEAFMRACGLDVLGLAYMESYDANSHRFIPIDNSLMKYDTLRENDN